MTAVNVNQLWATALADELVRGGVREAVICPGSRSSPLALALAAQPSLRTWSIVDERSGAFFALGLAKSTGRAAAIVATSGSAGAHFLPAAIEATLAGVPLILITADRPLELQGWGAPQTIPQHRLFGEFARHFADLGIPEATDVSLRHLRATVARSVSRAQHAPRGPVHLNVPFREPLAPTPQPFERAGLSALAEKGRPDAPFTDIRAPQRHVEPAALARVKERLQRFERGLIVCGPRDGDDGFGEAIAALSRATGYPVVAEAASQARFGFSDHLGHLDAILRNTAFAEKHRPDLVLRFGGGLTPRGPQQWLDASDAELVGFSEDGGLIDPAHRAIEVLEGDAVHAVRALSVEHVRERGAWFEAFQSAERRVRASLAALCEQDPTLSEPRIAREVVAALPRASQLFVSSSMPIRDVDALGEADREPVRVLANRGANGIDGITSSALGAVAGSGRPTVLLSGDLALLHDLHGLLIARRHALSLVIVVVNNDGGGIFSFLPIAGATDQFEALFGTPQGVDLAPLASFVGAALHRPNDATSLRAAIASGLASGGLHLIEVRTDRAENVRVHRAWFEALAKAVEGS